MILTLFSLKWGGKMGGERQSTQGFARPFHQLLYRKGSPPVKRNANIRRENRRMTEWNDRYLMADMSHCGEGGILI